MENPQEKFMNQEDTIRAYVTEQVAWLLGEYKKYMDLDAKASALKSEIDPKVEAIDAEIKEKMGAPELLPRKVSLLNPTGKMESFDPLANLKKVRSLLTREYDALVLERNLVGEGMKFQNPLIWLGYKKDAYRNTEKPLRTLGDLIGHCSMQGDICYKRFDAINRKLRETSGGDLQDGSLAPEAISLDELFDGEIFMGLCKDVSFMRLWDEHENAPSGKWKQYVSK